jgi:hypothetical protein
MAGRFEVKPARRADESTLIMGARSQVRRAHGNNGLPVLNHPGGYSPH